MHASDLHGPWSAIRRAPMVRLATPFIVGVALGQVVRPGPGAMMPLVLATSLPALLLVLSPQDLRMRWRRGLVVSTWLMAFGIGWQAMRSASADSLSITNEQVAMGPWLARVEAVNSMRGRRLTADASIVARVSHEGNEARRGRLLLTLLSDTANGPWPVQGDVLLVDGEVEAIARVPDPGGFDRTAWAGSRGIGHELFAPLGHWQVVGHQAQWTDLFSTARERISGWLNTSGLAPPELALVKALLLGQRDELDGEQRTAFARSGTIHVLAVSGMHVGLIYGALSFMLGWWGRDGKGRIIQGILILAALWGYAGITGASPSVLRATFMFSLFTAAGMARQRTDHLNSLFAAAFFLLLFDPALLRNAGFQLSFLAVLGIILFYQPINRLWSPGSWWLRKAWNLVAVSASAQLLTAPLSILLFKAFPLWFLPANIVVVTAAGFAVYGGVALVVLGWVPVLGDALAWVLQLLLRLVTEATVFFGGLPGAYPAVRFGMPEAVALYVMILAFAAWWQWRWRSMSHVMGMCFVAVLAMGAWRSKAAAERELFVVYDDGSKLVVGLQQGRRLMVASPMDSTLVDPGVMRRIDRHVRALGIEDVEPVGADLFHETVQEHGHSVMAKGRWRCAWLDVMFHSDAAAPMHPDGCDVLVAHDLSRVNEEVLEQLKKAGLLVIGPHVSSKARWLLKKTAEDQRIDTFSMQREGAFLVERTR